jgi:hypothetical protein
MVVVAPGESCSSGEQPAAELAALSITYCDMVAEGPKFGFVYEKVSEIKGEH